MLVEFRVRNFRSIRDDMCLTMTASKDTDKSETNTIRTGATPSSLLRTSVIYGPNASGKSALVFAIQFAQNMIRTSALHLPESPIVQMPFALDDELADSPTEFEFTFLIDEVRYQYGFSYLASGIEEEWLLVYKAPKPQLWFERKRDESVGNDVYKFGSSFLGARTLWKSATRRNSLFLSMAMQLNSENLRPIYQWLTEGLQVFNAGMQPAVDLSVEWLGRADHKGMILGFLSAADVGISDAVLDKRKMRQIRLEFGGESVGSPPPVATEKEVDFPLFLHKTTRGQASIPINEESAGTQRLFAFAAPLIDALNHGRTVVIDELDGSLHSHIVRFLVEIFHRPTTEKSAAQLIFTTHDTSLLDFNILRRDQIWFMEKGSDQSSTLTPLTDFSPRKNEALERGYLQGRYGALPMVSDFAAEDLFGGS
ncbi:hypothetical protein bAD24_III12690 [Burkholderia sp. AD24]|nr:hypothetical protein bAD24_III12690 [Burkholderia sp. AD24]